MVIVLKVQLALSIVMIASPWIFGYYEVSGARWVNVVLGLVLLFTSLFGILGRDNDAPGNQIKK